MAYFLRERCGHRHRQTEFKFNHLCSFMRMRRLVRRLHGLSLPCSPPFAHLLVSSQEFFAVSLSADWVFGMLVEDRERRHCGIRR